MTPAELLLDTFGRLPGTVHDVLDGLSAEDLAWRPTPEANSIGWLVWHLTRVQDDHVADAAGHEQVHTAGGWHERLGLPFPAADTGYGHTPDQVAAVAGVEAAELAAYFDAVHERTAAYLRTLDGDGLDRVVDTRWDPPVTLGVRLVSVADDDAQHVGQAAYVRGLLRASRS